MAPAEFLAERLRSHRLTAPASSVTAAAEHMLATQAQEFWGGRWALAARTRGSVTLAEVDAAFDRGELVRSWTQRGTIHILRPADLVWMLSLTGERQFRAAHSRHVRLGLGDDEFRRAEVATRAALSGGNRLTRAELFALFAAIGIDPGEQRGVHLLYALSVRGVIVQGPVVPRVPGPTRKQHFVLVEEWIGSSAAPTDPLTEFFTRFVEGHGPATAADFAWWSGLPLGTARRAAEAARDLLTEFLPSVFLASPRPRRTVGSPDVFALPPFDEYFLSYADRTAACAPEHVDLVATGGMMRPVVVAAGRVVGLWTHSRAVGRTGDPAVEILEAGKATDAEIAAAIARYRDFITGDRTP